MLHQEDSLTLLRICANAPILVIRAIVPAVLISSNLIHKGYLYNVQLLSLYTKRRTVLAKTLLLEMILYGTVIALISLT